MSKKETTIEETSVSPARANLLALIEKYKIQNPAKYASKKDELTKKLALL